REAIPGGPPLRSSAASHGSRRARRAGTSLRVVTDLSRHGRRIISPIRAFAVPSRTIWNRSAPPRRRRWNGSKGICPSAGRIESSLTQRREGAKKKSRKVGSDNLTQRHKEDVRRPIAARRSMQPKKGAGQSPARYHSMHVARCGG